MTASSFSILAIRSYTPSDCELLLFQGPWRSRMCVSRRSSLIRSCSVSLVRKNWTEKKGELEEEGAYESGFSIWWSILIQLHSIWAPKTCTREIMWNEMLPKTCVQTETQLIYCESLSKLWRIEFSPYVSLTRNPARCTGGPSPYNDEWMPRLKLHVRTTQNSINSFVFWSLGTCRLRPGIVDVEYSAQRVSHDSQFSSLPFFIWPKKFAIVLIPLRLKRCR